MKSTVTKSGTVANNSKPAGSIGRWRVAHLQREREPTAKGLSIGGVGLRWEGVGVII